jgi:hypothetical protein
MKKGDIVRVKTNAELLNYLFNKDYKQWMKTTYEYNNHIVWMVHFDGEKRDGWKNHLGEKLIIEENTNRLVQEPKTYLQKRIVFSKHNGYFIFEGIFKYDKEKSNPTSIRYYNLLSETFLEETRPSPNKNINLPFDRTYYYVSDKNIKVVLTNKYHVDEFFQLFANNKINTEIPRMPINTNAKLYTNRTHYCTSHSPTFKPIIAFAIGDSFDILLAKGSASLLPTIEYSSSSSSSTYSKVTLVPIDTTSVSTLVITTAFSIIASNSLILDSTIA